MNIFKSTFSMLLILIMILSLQSAVCATVKDTGFSDVSNDAWYASAVKYCVEHNLMSGTSAGKFSPDAPMNRTMLATAIYRMAGSPNITGTSGFTDVPQGTWYSDAVTWITHNVIMSGYGSGMFGANDLVTREQISTVLWRYSDRPAANSIALPFSDAVRISSYAEEAVAWTFEIGIINGKPNNIFDPKGFATRAETAMILYNYLGVKRYDLEPAKTSTPKMNSEVPVNNVVTKITITAGNAVYTAVLYDNIAANAFQSQLPMTINMSELNGNEKYFYLPDSLPSDAGKVDSIRAGDLMLYGSDCLVLFYKSFTTAYSYTKLGYIENETGLSIALGSGSIQVTFEINN